MTPSRPVFFISDHTGITAEIMGKSLLSQFPDEAFTATSLPFIDSQEKAELAARQVRLAWEHAGRKPLVYSTLTDPDARAALASCGALVMELYGHFLGMMVDEIGYPPAPLRGRFHGMGENSDYYLRINAVNFALAADDGLSTEKYQRADLILVGVSRSGKTPTSLYMAMQYGLNVANYPLTPENFDTSPGCLPGLPKSLLPHVGKLRGLTLQADRLAQIRGERRPGSVYSSLNTCREELRLAEKMLTDAGVPIVDATARSVEEIAALLKQSLKAA